MIIYFSTLYHLAVPTRYDMKVLAPLGVIAIGTPQYDYVACIINHFTLVHTSYDMTVLVSQGIIAICTLNMIVLILPSYHISIISHTLHIFLYPILYLTKFHFLFREN